LDQALVALDAALALAQKAGPSHRMQWEEQRKRRQELARREAREILDRLVRHDQSPFPLADWLNLIARGDHDPDVESLKPRIGEQFRSAVRQRVGAELVSARRSFDSGKVVVSLQSCDGIAKLLTHLDPDSRQAMRHDTEELVTRLLATHGVVVEAPQGQ